MPHRNKNENPVVIPEEIIEQRIYLIRGMKVMLDSDLAQLYGVRTYRLVEAVKRNSNRFPSDFMHVLTQEEFKTLRSQFAISKKGRGGRRYLPYAFTEQGVAMLSSVLNSERAIQVNIQIMRAFTKLRAMLASHEELRKQVEEMEKKYDSQFQIVFEAIKKMLEPIPPEPPKRRIGFHALKGIVPAPFAPAPVGTVKDPQAYRSFGATRLRMTA